MKMIGTIDFMSGAPESSSLRTPSASGGAAQAVSPVSDQAKSAPAARAVTSAARRPRRSAVCSGSCVGSVAGSPSTAVARSRGSMTRSVSAQPSSTITTDEAVVK